MKFLEVACLLVGAGYITTCPPLVAQDNIKRREHDFWPTPNFDVKLSSKIVINSHSLSMYEYEDYGNVKHSQFYRSYEFSALISLMPAQYFISDM